MAQRWIMHVDMDAFFASVEELLQPALRGKPLIVGGNPSERGVVSSASYAARAYGVRSAMPVAQALRLCPQAIVVPPRHGEYGRRSSAVMDILREITPAVEQVSIDEAFLDVTGCERLWGPVCEIGALIQRRVMDEQQLPVSLGIAANRLVAKIACDVGKPKGLVLVTPGEEANFLAPLPIERLWGVGQVTGGKLREMGITTIGDLTEWPEAQLVRVLGEQGHSLARAARGIDDSPLQISHSQRSISQERTFVRDVADEETLQRVLSRMSERVAARLRARHMVGQTVRIKLRYPDFTTITRQVTMQQPTDQGQLIYAEAWKLLSRNWQVGEAVRLLGVGVSGLLSEGGYQLGLFDRQDQRRIRLNRTLDDIRNRFGDDAIRRASWLDASDRGDDVPDND